MYKPTIIAFAVILFSCSGTIPAEPDRLLVRPAIFMEGQAFEVSVDAVVRSECTELPRDAVLQIGDSEVSFDRFGELEESGFCSGGQVIFQDLPEPLAPGDPLFIGIKGLSDDDTPVATWDDPFQPNAAEVVGGELVPGGQVEVRVEGISGSFRVELDGDPVEDVVFIDELATIDLPVDVSPGTLTIRLSGINYVALPPDRCSFAVCSLFVTRVPIELTVEVGSP